MAMLHLLIGLLAVQISLTCFPRNIRSPRLSATDTGNGHQGTCKTLTKDVEIQRRVSLGSEDSCLHYWSNSPDYESSHNHCGMTQLFNLDLCDCWDRQTVNETTCRTNDNYDVETLTIDLFAKYNTSVTKFACEPLKGVEDKRTLLYTNVGVEPCNRRHLVISYLVNRVMVSREGTCDAGKLMNFDLCECYNETVVDDQMCRTKVGFDIPTLRESLIGSYNWSSFLDFEML